MLFIALLLITTVWSHSLEVEAWLKHEGLSTEQFIHMAQKLPSVVQEFKNPQVSEGVKGKITLPLVFMHGMGDSCFNSGMKQITELAGQHMNVYSVCIPTGKRRTSDTMNGFFMTMDDNVDEWNRRVQLDDKLKNGFHAVGFSQGNSVIRGYIHKYNNPPVSTFLSVHGTVTGVAGFPNCDPSGLLAPVCSLLAGVCGAAAYEPFSQNLLFQADYFRDPKRYTDAKYLANSEIAQWNQENPSNQNATWVENFKSVKKYAMIKALKDTMIFPNEGEWWGQYAPGSLKDIQKMEDTDNYKLDRWGLKTVHEAGKMVFNTTAGNHLQFTQEELYFWLDNYLVE